MLNTLYKFSSCPQKTQLREEIGVDFANCTEHEYTVRQKTVCRRCSKIAKNTISFVISVCPSVRPHGTARLPLNGFSWNFIFQYFSKSDKNNGTLHDMVWYDMIWYDMIYDMIWYMIWYDMIWYICKLQLGSHAVAVVQYTWRPMYIFYHISPSSSNNEKYLRQRL
jgi:hypothetical protein